MPKSTPKRRSKPSRNPKDSHLYTDDNPSTTLHGTGFKDRATAEKTLSLIQDRSLTYQFQTVNTMYHRAKHHPAMKKQTDTPHERNHNMHAAMSVFRHWLDETYPSAKTSLRAQGFKPLLTKTCVKRFLSSIEESSELPDGPKAFARLYVDLPKGKRLANVLLDPAKPDEADWERRRYDALDALVAKGKEDGGTWGDAELWGGKGGERGVASGHLELIAWAWSPVGEKKLP